MSSKSRLAAAAPMIALAAGIGLASLVFVGGWIAALGVVLAQPALALGVSWQRRTRLRPSGSAWRADALGLLALWAAGFVVSAALVAWPLSALRQSGSLPAALGLSAVVGALLIGLWRTWPLWHVLERESASLATQWQGLSERDIHAWHGLGVAALVALVIGMGGMLAWPGLVPADLRIVLSVGYVMALPALHWALQRASAARTLPVLVMEPVASPVAPVVAEVPAVDEDLEASLFAAARAGRVERALELLELVCAYGC
jgi:hypothetical protein